MFTVHNILSYIQWRMHARDRQGHRIHSPFLYSLITNNLYNRITDDWVLEAERYRKQLLADKSMVNITDYGTGSRFASGNTRRVRDIACHSSTSPRDGRLLSNLATAMQCRNILELGTNLGLGTLYLANSAHCEQLVTIEGCPNLSAIANSNFNRLCTNKINVINEEFSKALPKALKILPSLDFLFIDGNHNGDATLSYFTQCLPYADNDTVFVIDDIHKDSSMESAWAKIIDNEKVTLSLDFFTMGVLFFRSQLSKQTICLRY